MSNVDSTKLTPRQLASMLKKAGAKAITVVDIEQDIAEGCPTNKCGTINLLHYAAWLIQRSVNA